MSGVYYQYIVVAVVVGVVVVADDAVLTLTYGHNTMGVYPSH